MADIVSVEWADILRIEGVDAKGFGMIPKLVMIDHELSYRAKAIYAYLCSQAGSGSKAFPARSTILRSLSMCKDAFYTHFNALISAGYVSVTRVASPDGRFGKNIYTLVSNPKKLRDYTPEEGERGSRLRGQGVKAAGYGSIPRTVMTDERLTIKAKALYAYLASFSGAGDVAFPLQKDLLYHMDMGVNTYLQAMKELIALNYVEVTQRAENGRFDRCDYHIVANPDEAVGRAEMERRKESRKARAATVRKAPRRAPEKRAFSKTLAPEGSTPSYKKQDMAQPVAAEEIGPYHKKQDMVKPDMAKSDMAEPDTVKSDMVKQDITINSPSINSSSMISPSIDLQVFDGLMDDKERREYIADDLGLPYIEMPSAYDIDMIGSLIDIILWSSHQQQLTILGTQVSRTDYMNRFLALDIDDYQYVIDTVAQQGREIRHPKAYYISCLYTAKESHALKIKNEIRQNMA